MKIRWGNVFITSIAVGVGLVTLAGYFIEAGAGLRLQFIAWASLLAAVALWVGALNLGQVHFNKVLDGSAGWPYSAVLLLAFMGVLVAGLVAPLLNLGAGPTSVIGDWVFRHLLSAPAAGLATLFVFILVFAAFRLLRRPANAMTWAFLLTLVVALISLAPAPAGFDLGLRDLWIWLAQVPAVAGARGLLIGIGLGVVVTGLRVLLAVDRPYGD